MSPHMDNLTIHSTSPSISHNTGSIELHYEKTEPPVRNPLIGPLVLCHGILGSSIHWRSFSRIFASRLGCPVYALDLRNHGLSPCVTPMTYTAMADDVIYFCQAHNLSNISLLGYSMGGKVAMSVALGQNSPKDLISHLIVVDIAPTKGVPSFDFRSHAIAVIQIQNDQVKSREEADKILAEVEPDPLIRAYLLSNTISTPDTGFVRFRFAAELMENCIENTGDFPYDTQGDHRWNGQTLFIKGKKSNHRHLNKHNIPVVQHFFPNFEMTEIDATHLVLQEKPHEIIEVVVNFIKN